MNWINYLGQNLNSETEVCIYTMKAPVDFREFKSPASNIKILRLVDLNGKSSLKRYQNYLNFYLGIIKRLKSWRPETVLYYETLSAFPALFYKKFVEKKAGILVHYHEYTTPAEYQHGMAINQWAHVFEKKMYSVLNWISHTNEDRLKLFIKDNQNIRLAKLRVLPNYPPHSWKVNVSSQLLKIPVRFVYVGALSMDTMFTREFADWINSQNGEAIWDIYSGNITQEARQYIESFSGKYINLRGSKDYFSLPDVLKDYQIGVVLYKGHLPNYIFNAPNKLFEYWACGLDVWFPDHMQTALQYIKKNAYPKILGLSFEKISEKNLHEMIGRTGLDYRPSTYFCEPVLNALFKKIMESDEN